MDNKTPSILDQITGHAKTIASGFTDKANELAKSAGIVSSNDKMEKQNSILDASMNNIVHNNEHTKVNSFRQYSPLVQNNKSFQTAGKKKRSNKRNKSKNKKNMKNKSHKSHKKTLKRSKINKTKKYNKSKKHSNVKKSNKRHNKKLK